MSEEHLKKTDVASPWKTVSNVLAKVACIVMKTFHFEPGHVLRAIILR